MPAVLIFDEDATKKIFPSKIFMKLVKKVSTEQPVGAPAN